MFAHLFKEPLFTKSGTDRELNAIENEYQKGLSSEVRAYINIVKDHIAIPGSLLNRFSTGNLATLQRDDVYDELRQFYLNNYSSNLMNLAIVSKHSVDELQKLAVKHFTGVENRNLPPRDFTNEKVYDLENSFGRIIKIIPEQIRKTLALVWILPVSNPWDKKKSSKYLAHLFDHEGPNSLLSYLIKKNFATGVETDLE